MTINTQSCKDFIVNISMLIGEDSNEKWKRIKKYSVEPYILRDFENSFGRILTIAEHNEKLFLYSLDKAVNSLELVAQSNEIEDLGKQYIGHKATLENLQQFISLCIKNDPNIVYADAYGDALNPKKWNLDWDFIPLDAEDYEIEENYLYYSIDNEYIFNWNIYNPKNVDQFACYIDRLDLYKIHCLFMPDYDTTYRFSIYETKDHYLYLGLNYSD